MRERERGGGRIWGGERREGVSSRHAVIMSCVSPPPLSTQSTHMEEEREREKGRREIREKRRRKKGLHIHRVYTVTVV